jgi:hypothetical protein
MAPPLAALPLPMAPHLSLSLSHLPFLSVELPTASQGASTLAMGVLPWRASHKLIFPRGMTKTDAHDLPLAIPALNFIRNEF